MLGNHRSRRAECAGQGDVSGGRGKRGGIELIVAGL